MSNYTYKNPIGALIRTSLVDFPSRVASTLFLHGCNLRCPYCYNKDFVTGSITDYDSVTFEAVITHLKMRTEVISGFVISGGEPTISMHTAPLIREAKDIGYAVKIDTNGMRPDRIEILLADAKTAPDFIALDIKTHPDRYIEFGAQHIAGSYLKRSIALIERHPEIAHEYRTVLVPGLVDEKDIEAIGLLLPKTASWQFAQFKPEHCLNEAYTKIKPYSDAEVKNLIECAKQFVVHAQLR